MDRDEILDLIANYAVFVDRNDANGFVDLFSSDALLKVNNINFKNEDLPKIIENSAKKYVRTFHFMSGSVIEFGKNGVGGVTYCSAHHVYEKSEGEYVDRVDHVIYDDLFVKEKGRWFFESRSVSIRFTQEFPATIGMHKALNHCTNAR